MHWICSDIGSTVYVKPMTPSFHALINVAQPPTEVYFIVINFGR